MSKFAPKIAARLNTKRIVSALAVTGAIVACVSASAQSYGPYRVPAPTYQAHGYPTYRAPQAPTFSAPTYSPYTGAGVTVPVPRQYAPPVVPPSNVDPTKTWQYRFVERAAPVVKGVRDCSAGGFIGGLSYGVGGVAGGCIAGAAGVTPGQVINRTFNRPAY